MIENNDKIQIKYYEEIYNDNNFEKEVIKYLNDYLNGKKDINNPYKAFILK